MIDRYDPFGRMMSVRQMMDRLLENSFVIPRGSQSVELGGQGVNVYEQDDGLVVEAPMPGVQPNDIDVKIENGVLTIHGQTKHEEQEHKRNYLVHEYQEGSFTRSVRLPETVDTTKCKATLDHGVLRVTLPRAEHAKPHHIEVQVGEGPRAVPTSIGTPSQTGQIQQGTQEQRRAA